MVERDSFSKKTSPFETEDLRKNLSHFLNTTFVDPISGETERVGNFRWGVYAFFDYDGEPIYVGQTNEKLRTRIRRHLTNQRTDAVAMSVLDPFEVCEIEVWPLPELQTTPSKDQTAKSRLNALERTVYERAVRESQFGSVLNEKDPPLSSLKVEIPQSVRAQIVSPDVFKMRSHPDFRIARRALTISRLAQVISERKVQGGLRRVLVTQAKRLLWLSDRRYEALGGASSVTKDKSGNNPSEDS